VNVSVRALVNLRTRVVADDGALLRTVINSTSITEAGVALGMLRDVTPSSTLVAALNLREVLRELPPSPFSMRVDFATLHSTAGLERRGQSWVKRLGDDRDAPEIEMLGQGNLCYDMVVRADSTASLLKPGPVKADFVPPLALAILIGDVALLREVIDLTQEMGVVHNPRFYLSIEDWQMEHAAETVLGLHDLF
jgi:hypothetical protein